MLRCLIFSIFSLLLITACGDGLTGQSTGIEPDESGQDSSGSTSSTNSSVSVIESNESPPGSNRISAKQTSSAASGVLMYRSKETYADQPSRQEVISEGGIDVGRDAADFLPPTWGKRMDCVSCDLVNSDLRHAILVDAVLFGANLTGANLDDAILVGADLRNAILLNADLRRADLRFTQMTNVDLTGANLDGAELDGAILNNANFDGAVNIRNALGADFDGAINVPKE